MLPKYSMIIAKRSDDQKNVHHEEYTLNTWQAWKYLLSIREMFSLEERAELLS